MAFLVPAMAELLVATPSFDEPDLTSLQAVSIGERAAGAADAAHPAGATARRDGVELVRHDRGRAGVHRDAEGRGDEADRIGRQAGRADGARRSSRDDDSDLRRPRGRRAADPDAGPAAGVLQGRGRRPRAPGPRTAGCAAATSATSTRTGSCTSSAARRTSSSAAATTSTRPTSRPCSSSTPTCRRPRSSAIPHAVLGEDIAAFVVRPARTRRSTPTRSWPSAPSASPTTSAPPGALRRRAPAQRDRQGDEAQARRGVARPMIRPR